MTDNTFDPNAPGAGQDNTVPPTPNNESVYNYSGATQNTAPGGPPPPGPGSQPSYPPQYQQPPQAVNQYAEVPPEIRKWNWGAFMFNMMWGIGNHAYLALLCLIPCFNIVWIFICGAMGNQWAWKSGEFKDVEQFMAVQRTWNRAGFIWFIVALCIIVLYVIIILIAGASLFAFMDQNNFSSWG